MFKREGGLIILIYWRADFLEAMVAFSCSVPFLLYSQKGLSSFLAIRDTRECRTLFITIYIFIDIDRD